MLHETAKEIQPETIVLGPLGMPLDPQIHRSAGVRDRLDDPVGRAGDDLQRTRITDGLSMTTPH